MSDEKSPTPDPSQLRRRALSQWDYEGGASRQSPLEDSLAARGESGDIPQLTNAELVQLRVRVIALENLVIALLAEAGDHQIALARDMATYVSPRPGFTHHPLTIHAASHMIDLVERAEPFRSARGADRTPVNETQPDA